MTHTYQDAPYTLTATASAKSVRIAMHNGKSGMAIDLWSGDQIIDPVPAAYAAKLRGMGLDPAAYVAAAGQVIRRAGLPAIHAAFADLAALLAADKAALLANVPGLDELREAESAAANEQDRYDDQFARMMDDEHNDGARPPAGGGNALATFIQASSEHGLDWLFACVDPALASRVAELRAAHPRAALYLRADRQQDASNHHKSAAGSQAKRMLAGGGDLEAARKTLEDWLPDSAWND